MARLADITSEIRIILKIMAVAATIVLVIFLFVRGGQIAKDLFFPSPPPPPEEKFGQLAKVSFPPQNPVSLKYRINTQSGKLPVFPDRMKVYKVTPQPASLVALATVRSSLARERFDQAETKISETVYRWSDTSNSSIQYNIVTNNFKISSNFLSMPPPAFLSGSTATKDGAYDNVIGFLENIGENTDDIDQTKTRAIYLKIINGNLVAATSQSDAQFIRIDLFQKDLNKKIIYYPTLIESPMYFIYRNENNNPKIVDANFFHYIAGSDSSDYAIKTAEAAYEDLESGNAYILIQNPAQKEIDITEVETGYFVGDNPEYFLPIVIFRGNGITAYVNALVSQ